MKSRYYVGLKDGKREVFISIVAPTEKTHGYVYTAVIGPFQTRRGAQFMAAYGANNPHLQTVAEAEKHAKRAAINGLAYAYDARNA